MDVACGAAALIVSVIVTVFLFVYFIKLCMENVDGNMHANTGASRLKEMHKNYTNYEKKEKKPATCLLCIIVDPP